MEPHPLLLLSRHAPSKFSSCDFAKPCLQWTRRYSIVVSQVALIALNILFFVSKFDSRMPDWTGEWTLVCLSSLGMFSLIYTFDWMYKTAEDLRFAFDFRSKIITLFALSRIGMQFNNAALIMLNFNAAILGAAGQSKQRNELYGHMILWGEISLLLQVFMLFGDIALVAHTKKSLEGGGALPASFAPRIRFCMDKDTLWKLEEAKSLPFDQKLEIVIQNLTTQLKITYGSRLGLIFLGDILLALEKWKTPNSKTAAAVNLFSSLLWGGMICLEKWQEITQRERIDQENRSLDIEMSVIEEIRDDSSI